MSLNEYVEEALKIADEELRLDTKLLSRVLTHREEKILRQIVKERGDSRMQIAILGTLELGLRASEFVHLTRDSIDFVNRKLSVKVRMCECSHCQRKLKQYWKKKKYDSVKLKKSTREKALTRKKHRLKGIWTAKSSAGYRTIDLSDEAFYILKSVFAKVDDMLQIYPSVDSFCYHITKVNDILPKDFTKKVTAHSNRATKLSRIAEETKDPYKVMTFAGHENIEMGMKYVKLFTEEIQ
ncbi:MAG: tyrosine-type recombinase/integrase [Candidatus Heimdallarchaeaceae archaeon]